jgi:hypothetical protein
VPKSKPPAAEIDLVDSYARRVGDEVELSLARPAMEVPDGAVIVLRADGGRHAEEPEMTDDAGGRRLVARLPRAALGDGTYVVRLRTADGSLRLGCRLLVQGERPLVLLWGDKTPPSTLPVSRPAPPPA